MSEVKVAYPFQGPKHPDYETLFKDVDLSAAAEDVLGGYFSIDRKKVSTKAVEVFKDTRGDTKADDDTYNLIATL